MLTITSLTHPTMMAKIQRAMRLAGEGRGEEMNGHNNRCYIQNEKGHNIMRLDYRRGEGFTVYAEGSRVITKTVAKAIKKFFTTSA